jgi:hypothetical protein
MENFFLKCLASFPAVPVNWFIHKCFCVSLEIQFYINDEDFLSCFSLSLHQRKEKARRRLWNFHL